MIAASVLRKARQLLSDERRWTQNAYARDEYGNPVDPDEAGAECFCVMGAMMKFVDRKTEEGRNEYFVAARMVGRQLPKGLVLVNFNDTHGHGAVLNLLDRAIAATEAVPA